MTLYKILAVGLGGFLGTVARYAAVKSVDEKINGIFPYGTFAVNILGSLLLGIIYTAALRKAGITEHWRLFLGVGFCGGFTTFSAFAWENFSLIEQKFMGTSAVYALASLGVGLLALMAGVWIGRFL